MRDWQGNNIPNRLEGSEMRPAPLSQERVLELRTRKINKILGVDTPKKNVCEIIAYRTDGECLLDFPAKTKEELEALPDHELKKEFELALQKEAANEIKSIQDMTLEYFKSHEVSEDILMDIDFNFSDD